MADLRFANYTALILNDLPHWFKMRKQSKDSIGARFLNIAGLELDDARYVIDYAYQQCYIDTADITQVDFCYKAIIPMPLRAKDITSVYANNTGLYKAESLKEFFGIDLNGIQDKNLHSFENYYIDEDRNIIYVRQKFNADAINNNGKIKIIFNNIDTHIIPLVPHQVWNFFDEFGALLSCPRLSEEPNIEYKKRILDVFQNKANASKDGLINGIARELGMRRNITWTDPTKDLELEDSMIVLNSIKIDGEYIDPKKVFITKGDTVLIKSYDVIENNNDEIKERQVTYVYGLEMHQLHNHDDIKLYNELYTEDYKPKQLMKNYIDRLNSEAPLFWDHFHWNEHYWNLNEQDVSGLGFVPHLNDGSMKGFKNYKG